MLNHASLFSGALSVFAAGACGSLLRVIIAPPDRRSLIMAHVVAGAAMAVFVAPAIVSYWFRAYGIEMQRGIAFGVGVTGPLLAEVVIRLIQRRGDKVADRLIDRVAGPEDQK
ncbi:putative membrane protein [Burkholderia cenocepacia]|uniref:Membrane protein n=1 Tax=Burkholderia cenocepacia TaxID=95486 RepID=A0AAN0RSP8_9BURK|nr:putative membrane protein [Burkholderia cenocepacia]